ncbi:MAG: metallophosphoesterase [Magnetococcales bacterium]|nr:metallophosphoesterase [Magnetococcales bacterium]
MGWIQSLKERFVAPRVYDQIDLIGEVHLMKDDMRVPYTGVPIQIILGKRRRGKKLWICPEFLLDADEEDATPDFILFDPEHFFQETSGFLRLEAGESLQLGRGDKEQQAFFHFSRDVARRHVAITHDGDGIILKDLTARSGTYITPLGENLEEERLVSQRMSRLGRIRRIYGGPLDPLPPQEACNTLVEVNDILTHEGQRPLDHERRCGGLLQLSDQLTPLVVGDLHGQVDNLLKIISENHFLGGLERGKIALIILGDAVHSEIDGQMDDMASSMLMMDLIFKLKRRFPEQVHYILGNHDGFSETVMKAGIPQGLLWKRHLKQNRGRAYIDLMERFYRRSPYCVISKHLVACHAGPAKGKVSREDLINMRENPRLIREITWNRLRRPNYPLGYTRLDVARFRRGLELVPETPFIVAHNPLSRDKSVWMDIDDIPHHHIIFSGLPDQVSVFFQIKGQLVPLIYKAEPLLGLINRI